MKRAPSEPTGAQIESPRALYVCVNSTNINPTMSDQYNACIFKCRKREPGDKRHSMHLASDNSLECHKWEGTHIQPTCPGLQALY